jgi:bifunctional non-homologous end joining protein LigD
MALEEYRRKRKFSDTPEPSGAEAAPQAPAPRFVVQMHHASRLHFDFRLEMDGVLKSWAVPKGPTLDPNQKRLAMMVEDHPLDYMTFEGIIPAGNYGAGTVMVWDIGAWEPLPGRSVKEMLEKGDLKFRLHGQKLRGEFAIVHIKGRRPGSKGNEWLLLKKKDDAADPTYDAARHDRSALTGRTLVEIAADRSSQWGQEKAAGAAQKAATRTIAMMGSVYAGDPATLPGARAAEMPAAVHPMLAELAESAPEGPEWLAEIKWDGIRAVAFIGQALIGQSQQGSLRLVSRNQRDITAHYPDLANLPRQVRAARAVIDGEIVCLEDDGRASFERLQQRMNLRSPNPRKVAEYPAVYYAFDLIYLEGYDLRATPLEKRKEVLRAILTPPERPDDRLRYADHHAGEASLLFKLAKQQGLEGIVAKRKGTAYREERSGDWLKIKTKLHQDCVVCGWTEPKGSRSHFGSLILGVYEDGKLQFAGTAGSGFDQRTLTAVWKELQRLKKAKPTIKSPFSGAVETMAPPHWVEPRLVAEIEFGEWTEEGRMRAPVYQHLRADKLPEDCVRERASAPLPAPPSVAPLFSKHTGEEAVEVDGQRMRIQNLGKVFFPQEGYSKADVIEYYFRVSSYLLPHMKDKPVVMKRYPDGATKPFFFQKDAGEAMPCWVRLESIVTGQGPRDATRFVICNDRATLVYLANLGCIDQNLWQSRVPTLDQPDFILFDLDPGKQAHYGRVVETALALREVLSGLGLEAYPKTSGADGLHLYVPLEPHYSYEQARQFAEVVCRVVEHRQPRLMTHERSLSRRPQDRIYLDYMQIGWGKTVPPPYSLRPHPGATISTPLAWDEVRPGLDPAAFTIRTIWARLAKKGDLFAGVLTRQQKLEDAIERLSGIVG